MMAPYTSTEAKPQQGGHKVDFVAVLDQVIALLRQRGRVTYRTLQLQFTLTDEQLAALKDELLFGAPLAHEDHAVRACYAALAMQEALHRYAEEVRRTQGLLVQMRVGLNSGEVVARVIGNDLHMDLR
jgi:adenylate/guanylate cyclase family protein